MPDRRIAIVGMACRFPRAPDLGSFWDNILGAEVCFADIPRDRWNHDLFYHPSAREPDKTYARKVGIVDDIWSFPALHYGLAPLRVKVTDPQHRLFIDAVRAALADAGYERRPYPRATTGVFVGASVAEHKDIQTLRMRAVQMADGQFGAALADAPMATEAVTPIRAFSIAGNLLNMMAATASGSAAPNWPSASWSARVRRVWMSLCSATLAPTNTPVLARG